jgi:hypothetical protein
LDQFENEWKKKREEIGFSIKFYDELTNYSYYKKTLKKGKTGSDSKIAEILVHKQFFSVPWLLCYE